MMFSNDRIAIWIKYRIVLHKRYTDDMYLLVVYIFREIVHHDVELICRTSCGDTWGILSPLLCLPWSYYASGQWTENTRVPYTLHLLHIVLCVFLSSDKNGNNGFTVCAIARQAIAAGNELLAELMADLWRYVREIKQCEIHFTMLRLFCMWPGSECDCICACVWSNHCFWQRTLCIYGEQLWGE